ncbi:MAG: hypothetical protein CMF16_02280 [Idiomarina sp.]|jgi:hypothetical protein|nr:hypothetical protein [Idiomarina sp.]MBF79644.1 hypothetical protein [Idiomarina sp.]|tara:strand:- start:60 stop:254 length:195 start_codon:yes stop_codon:yes gene_type:complete
MRVRVAPKSSQRQLSWPVVWFMRRLHRFRLKLIDAIDTILDSLIGAVGTGTALKEIKDMLRAQT